MASLVFGAPVFVNGNLDGGWLRGSELDGVVSWWSFSELVGAEVFGG